MTARTLARAGAIVGSAYLASRVLGWLRLVIIGNLFGASPELDAYLAAFRIPDLIYQLVAAGAISSALIPVLTGLLHDGQRERASRVVSTVANAMLAVLVVLALIMFLFAPQLMPIFVAGFDAQQTELTVTLTRIMLISPILLAAGAVASAVLNTEGRFAAAATAPLLYNVAIIGAALLLTPALGVESLAVGVVIGSLLHIAVQIPAVRRRIRYQPLVDASDAAARQIMRLLLPRAIGLAANQITFIVNTSLATLVAVGAVTVYTLAFTIFVIPVGVIGLPLGVLMLPALSRAMAAGELRTFGTLLVGTLRLLVFVMLFLSAVGIVLSRQVVELLFGYGAFDGATLDLTARLLSIFLIGLAGNTLCLVLARAFFSGQDTTTPLLGVLLAVGTSVAVSLLTIQQLGLTGLAIGVALGDTAEAVFLALALRRRWPAVEIGSFLRVLPVIGLGALLAGGAAFAVVIASGSLVSSGSALASKPFLLAQVVAATAAGGAAYLIYTRLVRLPELPRAIGLVRSSLQRRDPSL